jgi:hypothetical protein
MALATAIQDANEKEAEIMKHRKGWKTGESVYSKRWNTPLLHTENK